MQLPLDRRRLAWILLPMTAGCVLGFVLRGLVLCRYPGRRKKLKQHGYAALIGNTPLVKLQSLSAATGCEIWAKAEFLNPGGTSKDRVALHMIEEAEQDGRLKEGGTVIEGTSGSTGIALAALCKSKGYSCVIVMPDDQAEEKRRALEQYAAKIEVVKPASIANPNHYYNRARSKAAETPGGVFMDQFETPANFNAHYQGTGPEIWEQMKELGLHLDAFVMSAGTGGTIAGVSQYLKQQDRNIKVFLVDPPGSSLYHKVKHGVCYAPEQKEQGIRRHRYDTIAEGIGLDRLTKNFEKALVDDAVRVSDQEALLMAHSVLHTEGLSVGSSTAMNLVGAVVAARKMGPGHTIVTVLCDSGQRHQTRFWNRAFVETNFGLSWPETPPESLEFVGPRSPPLYHTTNGHADDSPPR